MRGRPELERVGAGGARRRGGRVRRLEPHPRGARRRLRARRPRARDPARRRHRRVAAATARDEALAGLLDESRGATRRTRANANERIPDEGNAERLADVPRRRRADRRLLREAALQQGRPRPARRRARARRAHGDRRLRGLPGRARGDGARRGRSSPGRSSTATSSICSRSPTSRSCRRSSPRPSGWSPRRRPPPGRRRSSRGTRASPRSRTGSRRSTRRTCATWPASRTVTPPISPASCGALLALPPEDRRALRRGRAHGGRRALELGRGRAPAARSALH